MRLIALLLLLVVGTTATAQQNTPTQRAWSIEGRAPQWRARIEAREGTLGQVSVLQRDADGVVVAIIEERDERRLAFVERRDRGGQVVWRQPVPGVPERTQGLSVFAVEGKTRADLTIVAAFNLTDAKVGDPFARIIEVDLRGGTLRIAGSFTYPKKSRDNPEDWMELTKAKALPSGLIAFYGGVGSGPFFWWVGLRKPDGTVVWDVVSQRGLGHVVDLRPDGDGIEASVVNVMSRDQERGTGTFRVRIDAKGKITSSAKLWQRESGPRFLGDGGMTYVTYGEKRPSTIEVLDRRGQRRFSRTLPEDAFTIERCLDDGAIVLSRQQGFLILAPDGNSMIVIASESAYGMSILPDGAVLDSRCDDTRNCKAQTLSLFDRPR